MACVAVLPPIRTIAIAMPAESVVAANRRTWIAGFIVLLHSNWTPKRAFDSGAEHRKLVAQGWPGYGRHNL
jgi:hypothetical protein